MKRIFLISLLSLVGVQTLSACGSCWPSRTAPAPEFLEQGRMLVQRLETDFFDRLDSVGQDRPEHFEVVINQAFAAGDTAEFKAAVIRDCYFDFYGTQMHLVHKLAKEGMFETLKSLVRSYPILHEVQPLYKYARLNERFLHVLLTGLVDINKAISYQDLLLLLKFFLGVSPEHDPKNIQHFLTTKYKGVSPLQLLINVVNYDMVLGLFNQFPRLQDSLVPLIGRGLCNALQRPVYPYPAWIVDQINNAFPARLDRSGALRVAALNTCYDDDGLHLVHALIHYGAVDNLRPLLKAYPTLRSARTADGTKTYIDAIAEYITMTKVVKLQFDDSTTLIDLLQIMFAVSIHYHQVAFWSAFRKSYTTDGEPLIYVLIKHGWIKCVEELRTASTDIFLDRTTDGRTVFHAAVLAPWILMDEHRNVRGPLIKKSTHILLEIASLSVLGADGRQEEQSLLPLSLLNHQDKEGKTALHLALENSAENIIIDHLIKLGARTDIRDKAGATAMQLLERRGCYSGGRPTEKFIAAVVAQAARCSDSGSRDVLPPTVSDAGAVHVDSRSGTSSDAGPRDRVSVLRRSHTRPGTTRRITTK